MIKIQVVDLFCGMGGFSHGATKAGCKVVLAIDSWKEAIDVHTLNHPETEHKVLILGNDIKKTAKLILSYIDQNQPWHLHGSPPCQKLSIANRRSSNIEEAMKLVNWYLKLVQYMKPNSWTMEQVPTVIKYLPDWIPNIQKIDASKYGTPQTRNRLFCGSDWKLTIEDEEKMITPNNVLPNLHKEGDVLRGYSVNRPVCKNGKYIGLKKIVGLDGTRTLDEPTFTICASGPLKLEKIIDEEKEIVEKIRSLTVDECKILQGFDDDYKLQGKMKDKRTMVGNSVCPLVAKKIMSQIKLNQLKNYI